MHRPEYYEAIHTGGDSRARAALALMVNLSRLARDDEELIELIGEDEAENLRKVAAGLLLPNLHTLYNTHRAARGTDQPRRIANG